MSYCLKQGQHTKIQLLTKVLLATPSFNHTSVVMNMECIDLHVFVCFAKYSKYLSMIYCHNVLEYLSLVP